MKTIEQLLKPIIQTDIQSLLESTELTLKLTNDLRFRDIKDTRNTISAVIKTGQGTRATVQGISAIQSPIQIIFQIPVNEIQNFLMKLNNYCHATNMYPGIVTDDLQDEITETQINYEYKLSWGVAIPAQSPYQIEVATPEEEQQKGIYKESIEVDQIVLIGTVTYTSDLKLDDEEYYLLIENAVELEVKSWLASIKAYYNLQDPADRLIVTNMMNWPAVPTGYLAANYPVGFALKVSDGTIPESAAYYMVTSELTLIDGYVKIEGITNDNEVLAPTIIQTPLMEEYRPATDVTGDTQAITLTIVVKPDNSLHKYLLGKFYAGRDKTSFNATMKRTRTSLEVSQENIPVIINDMSKTKTSGFEYLTFTIARRW